jgi:hypothetical protein
VLALGASLAAALKPLTVQGNSIVDASGDRFQIVGAAYQPGGSAGYDPASGKDPLSDADNCLRDAALMQILGINTIRVYNLDPDLNHDECASIFNAAGMYMALDVNSPLVGQSLDASQPWTTYYDGYLNRTFAVVEAFRHYPNTLLFFAGNEVIQAADTFQVAPPYVRAVVRDLKNYIAKHADRPIPVGYSAADVRSVLYDTWNYLQCDIDGKTDDMSHVDIFALNSYSWCGESNFVMSTYSQLVGNFTNSSVPLFFSEFGCIKPAPRVFTEIGTIYSDQMWNTFSGGVVYEYAEEVSDYGLVNISADGSAQLLRDYDTLLGQYQKLNFSVVEGIKASSQAPTPPTCTSSLITTANFSTNWTLPDLPPNVQGIIDNGVSPMPTGKIVSISDWTVKQTVKRADGSVIENLAVVPLPNDEVNQPGLNSANGSVVGNTTVASNGTNSTNGTKPNAAPGTTAPSMDLVMMLSAVLGFGLLVCSL